MSLKSAVLNSRSGTSLWESHGVIGRRDSTFKRPMHKLTCSETQPRGSTLKSAGATCEGDLLTNCRVCAKGAGIYRNFGQEWEHWWVPFFLPSCLGGPTWVGTSSDALHLPCQNYTSYPKAAPPNQLLPDQTHQQPWLGQQPPQYSCASDPSGGQPWLGLAALQNTSYPKTVRSQHLPPVCP